MHVRYMHTCNVQIVKACRCKPTTNIPPHFHPTSRVPHRNPLNVAIVGTLSTTSLVPQSNPSNATVIRAISMPVIWLKIHQTVRLSNTASLWHAVLLRCCLCSGIYDNTQSLQMDEACTISLNVQFVIIRQKNQLCKVMKSVTFK